MSAVSTNSIAQTILASQKQYVDRLQIIIKTFMKPIAATVPSVTPKQRKILFTNITELYCMHVEIHSDLEVNTTGDGVFKMLSDHKKELTQHAEFECNLAKSLELLDSLLRTDKDFHKAVTGQESKQLKLKQLMLDVADIITLYRDKLNDMLRVIDKSDQAKRSALDKALRDIRDLIEFIERYVREHSSLEKLAEVEKQLEFMNLPLNVQSLSHYGRLIFTCDLKLKSRDKEKTRFIILLDKILLISSKTHRDKYRFEAALDLSNYLLHEETQTLELKISGRFSGLPNYTFATSNAVAFATFVTKFKKTVAALNPQTKYTDDKHHFVLYTFPAVTLCDYCQNLLKGALYQGYICVKTKKICHLECIYNMAAAKIKPEYRQREIRVSEQLMLPTPAEGYDSQHVWFGGYFGNIVERNDSIPSHKYTNKEAKEMLIETVCNKILSSKGEPGLGGFKYLDFAPHAVPVTSPQYFLLWESKSRGVRKVILPKLGFLTDVVGDLKEVEGLITLSDFYRILDHVQGTITHYTDLRLGEDIIVGNFNEQLQDGSSSEDDEDPDLQRNESPRVKSQRSHRAMAGSKDQTLQKPLESTRRLTVASFHGADSRKSSVASNHSNATALHQAKSSVLTDPDKMLGSKSPVAISISNATSNTRATNIVQRRVQREK